MARPRPQLVYANSFGSHRCGSVIRYGQGGWRAEAGRAGSQPSPTGEALGPRAATLPADKASPELSAAGGSARSWGGTRPGSRHRGPPGPGTSASRGVGEQRDLKSLWSVRDTHLAHGYNEEKKQGDLRETKADVFDFPFPSRNVDKVIKRKKKKSKIWRKVWKVISKMLEENEKFRGRLLTCSQFNGEGNAMNQSSQNETSYLDREETIFGWV